MRGDAFYLARKDTRYLFRAKETWLWTFLMPVIFFYFIGTVTGGFGSSGPDPKDPIGLVAPPDAGFLVDQLARRVESLNYAVARVETEAGAARYRRRLMVPARFTETVLGGKPAKIVFARDGGGIATDYDRVRLARAVYTLLADLVVLAKDGGKPAADDFKKIADEPRKITVEVVAAGKRQTIPTGFEHAIPGTLVQFTLLVLFTSGAVTITIERKQGILRRLASSPMSRGSVVLGKWMARMALGVIQIAFAMLTGAVVFNVSWGPHVFAVIALLLVYAAFGAALGMLLGTLARTEGQTIGIGVLSTNIMAALGGCWWPIEITPGWMQRLALAFPTGWAMDALHKLVSFGAGPGSIVPHLAAMIAAACLAGWCAARWFRFQ